MKVMALDGNSLVYRAFFALPDTMATAGGEVTNAVFGFCSMFLTLVKDHNPDAVVVVFDRKEKSNPIRCMPSWMWCALSCCRLPESPRWTLPGSKAMTSSPRLLPQWVNKTS
jgi:hypothetical protein